MTSKFQSAHNQLMLSQINTMLSAAIPQVPVECVQPLLLRREGKVKPVAKVATAPPAKAPPHAVSVFPAKSPRPAVVKSPQAFKNTLEKPPNVAQKHNPHPKTKSVVAKEKQVQTKTKLSARDPPKTTVSPRKIDSPKIIAFGRTLANPVMLSDSRRKYTNSGLNDFKVTKSAYKPTKSTIFSYDLSPLERKDYGSCHKNPMNPMKSVPPTEVQLLQSGQRSTYLEKRYDLAPDAKYNYPEATSMRYGWFHRLGNLFQERKPRRD